MKALRTDIVIKPDHTRVLYRPFELKQEQRFVKIIARIMSLSEAEIKREIDEVMADFHYRHPRIKDFFLKRFEQVRHHLLTDQPLSENRKLLIGAYFTQEYSLESAALFNPSIVWHPDQSNLDEGSRRFIISLRATGEGHISSITFRAGIIDNNRRFILDKPSRFVTTPEMIPNTSYEKTLFERKLFELGLDNEFSDRVFTALDDYFSLNDLQENINYELRQNRNRNGQMEMTARGMMSLAQSNYEVKFSPDQPISERIIFPSTPAEVNGIEDARFVQFYDDDGHIIYYATYTAYDGKVILPQLLETTDFLHFKISTLNGSAVQNKGLALFPRKINSNFAMLSRQDNENIYIMFSKHIHFWHTKQILLKPTFPWEFVQLGNCGSPIETEAGWIVLSHGVGPMRKYVISVFLLDLKDPTRVIGRLKEPLITPNENEREGYVPNVVYSCGGLIHNRELIIPYAMSDYATSFVTVNLEDLLKELTSSKQT